MNKLSKTQCGEFEAVNVAFQGAWQDASEAVETYNLKETTWKELKVTLDDLESAKDAAHTLITATVEAMQEYYDSKSEKWQEGDKGTAYYGWIESWQDMADRLQDTMVKMTCVAEVEQGNVLLEDLITDTLEEDCLNELTTEPDG